MPDLIQRVEDIEIQFFRAISTAKSLDIRILRLFAWLNDEWMQRNALALCRIKRPDGPGSWQASVNLNAKYLAVENIRCVECAEAQHTSQGIGHETVRSSLI